MGAGHPRSFTSVQQLQDGIDTYYAECKVNSVEVAVGGHKVSLTEPLSVSGLASSLGVSRETLHAYASGTYDEAGEYSDTIKKAVAAIERDKVAKAMLGVYDRTICIFDLKNNHGWRDQQHIESVSDNTNREVYDDETVERVADRLKALLGGG